VKPPLFFFALSVSLGTPLTGLSLFAALDWVTGVLAGVPCGVWVGLEGVDGAVVSDMASLGSDGVVVGVVSLTLGVRCANAPSGKCFPLFSNCFFNSSAPFSPSVTIAVP